jgi:hypothetical protein
VTARDLVPRQVRAAGALVAGQGLAAIGFAAFLVAGASGASLSVGAVLGEAGLFTLIGIVLAGLGIGLARGGRGARTPAIVVQLLLLPVVYSLIGPSQQLVLGIVTGVYVAGTFLLLISEPSRRWAAAPYDPTP